MNYGTNSLILHTYIHSPLLLCLVVLALSALIPGGGGGTPHMKGVGMLVGNFELNS